MLHEYFVSTVNAVNTLIGRLSDGIKEAAAREDFQGVERLNKAAVAIKSVRSIVEAEHEKQDCCVNRTSGTRQFEVLLTTGAIKQSYLTVAAGVKARLFQTGDCLNVILPGNSTFQTKVMPGKRLQERGKIRQFYASGKTMPGDVLIISEKAKGIWTVNRK